MTRLLENHAWVFAIHWIAIFPCKAHGAALQLTLSSATLSSRARLRTRQCAQTKDSRLILGVSSGALQNRWACRRASLARSASTAATSGELWSSANSSALHGNSEPASLVASAWRKMHPLHDTMQAQQTHHGIHLGSFLRHLSAIRCDGQDVMWGHSMPEEQQVRGWRPAAADSCQAASWGRRQHGQVGRPPGLAEVQVNKLSTVDHSQ